jgi:TatD DNase family protein
MSNTAKSRRTNASCPCCAILPDDLFLPSAVSKNDDDKEEEDSSAAPATASSDSLILTPQQAHQALLRESTISSRLQIVDTHCHAHLERSSDNDEESGSEVEDSLEPAAAAASISSAPYQYPQDDDAPRMQLVSLTCAVEPTDWPMALEYAAQSPYRIPAIGIHPWYLSDYLYLPTGTESDHDNIGTGDSDTAESSQIVLQPRYMQQLEAILQEHPRAAVGEIGLCKMARWTRRFPDGKQAALQIQRRVFQQQLQLAATYQRPVTIHCVNQQGILLDVLKTQQASLPPAMALHSFTGTAHHVQQLLKWEASLSLDPAQSAPLLYFGFSHAVNYVMCTSIKSVRMGKAAVAAVPADRLLAESDVHDTADVLGGTVGAVAYLAWALDESVSVVAERTARNGLRFLSCLL